MWISLLIALITYMASPKGDAKERRKALLTAAAVGGAAYLATEYTDWGRDISDRFDDAVGIGGSDASADDADDAVAIKPPIVGSGGGSGGSGSTGGFSSWWPTILGAGTGAAVASGVPAWVIWGGIALLVYTVIK